MKRCLPFAVLFLAGCSGLFGVKEVERSRVPADAIAYECDEGKKLYLRWLNNRDAAWIIFPEREFRLDKAAQAGRYSNGAATLEVGSDSMVTLTDAPNVDLKGCKLAASR